MRTTESNDIDRYLAGFPKNIQKKLEQVRTAIKKTAPQAKELISYNMPAFKLNGMGLVYYAAYKNHIGLYPAPRSDEAFKKELSAYRKGKGTIQFPLNKPTPLNLITKIVKFRVKENLERMQLKNQKEKVKTSHPKSI